jgi:hypothetical protein
VEPTDLLAAANRVEGEVALDSLRELLEHAQRRFEEEAASMAVTNADLDRSYNI